jgi:hypothetical protein
MVISTIAVFGIMSISAASAHAQKPEEVPAAVRSITAISQIQDVDQLERRIQRLELLERQRRADEARDKLSESFEGSWAITVTPVVPPGVPQPPQFQGFATISRGGAYYGSDRTRPFSKQQGNWEYTGGNGFAWTFTEDLFDIAGNFVGTIKVRAKIIVIGNGEFIGVSNGEQRDLAGNVVFNRCATIRGARIPIEPLSPQCQSIVPPQ